MQIAKVDVIPVDIPLATPVRMATHTISRAANVLVRMESTDGVNLSGKIAETSIASAALTHIAAAAPALAWGFSVTNHNLEADVVRRPLAPIDGSVHVPEGPGLGVDIDEQAIAHYRVAGA
jgi:L-alanine-DL-glutamate epimerase-like enolase superfamily enzyme